MTRTVPRRFISLLALTIAVPLSASGQHSAERVLGARVRLETASGRLVTGTVVGIDADTVRLISHSTAPSIAVPRATIVGYEVSAGRERGRGARRGAVVGGALGLALVVASLASDTASVNRQPNDLRLAVVSGAGLVALGAALGAGFAPERWESVRGTLARARVRGAVCPGACVAIAVRFP